MGRKGLLQHSWTLTFGLSLESNKRFFLQVLIALTLATVALADRPNPYQPAPAYKPRPAYPEPADVPPQYQYQYAVKDDYAGVDFTQNEARDNYATNGEYRVLLPDGRTQIVTYNTADAYSGNIADVRYEGEARYDPAPAPSYKPTPPAYRPIPAYPAPHA